jgi:chromosomal replication initiator protein
MAILQQKAHAEDMMLPDEVVLYIAKLIRSNIRALEGALIKLHAYASLMKTPVTPILAAEVLGHYFGLDDEGPLDAETVQRAVCEKMNIPPADICSASRTKDLVLARQIAMYLARQLTPASLPTIGKLFGGRDHSTVLHACNKIASMLQEDRRLSALVEELARELRNGSG